MGYRSDVRIVVTKEGYKKLEEFVENYLKGIEIAKQYNLLNHKDIEKVTEEYHYLGWNYIKWYEGDYEDVNSIVKGLDYLAENDFSFRFARIGEQYDDIEERNFDSEKEGYLEYPSILREFDDDIF